MTEQLEPGDYVVFSAVAIYANIDGEPARAVLRESGAFLIASGAVRELDMETPTGRKLVPLWGDDPMADNLRNGIRGVVEHLNNDAVTRFMTRTRDYCAGAGISGPKLMLDPNGQRVKIQPGASQGVLRFITKIAHEMGWTIA